jgi:hypothetical protein
VLLLVDEVVIKDPSAGPGIEQPVRCFVGLTEGGCFDEGGGIVY